MGAGLQTGGERAGFQVKGARQDSQTPNNSAFRALEDVDLSRREVQKDMKQMGKRYVL